MIVDAWSGGMTRLAVTLVGNTATADEIVQDTWLSVIESIDTFEGRSSLRHWVYRILTHRAYRRRTRDAREVPTDELDSAEAAVTPEHFRTPHETFPGHWSSLPQTWPTPQDALEEAEVIRVVGAAVDRLPTRQRAVITLRDLQGFDAAATRELLGLTEGNERVLLHRARSAVRAELEKHFARGV